MKITNISLVYFSATNTTRKVVRTVAEQFDVEKTEYNITRTIPKEEVRLGAEDLLIIGMPVYAGRIPAISLEGIKKFKGSNTPAISICVYGNRDYDDALLELNDLLAENGFKVLSAAAFIAQHSIFPKVGEGRPDEKDLALIKDFALQTIRLLDSTSDISQLPEIKVSGQKPYKVPGSIPIQPKGNAKCDQCGVCVKACPTQAIPADKPRTTDKQKCISCGRCIVVCPQQARSFGGLLYKVASQKFVKANLERREPITVFCNQ